MTRKQTPKAPRTKKVSTKSTQTASSVDEVSRTMSGDLTRDKIARRAHQIWLDSGRQPNCDLQNWYAAEKQLRDE